MSTIAEGRVRSRPAARKPDAERREYRAALHCCAELAAADCADLDEQLRLVAARAADLVGVPRCRLHLREERQEDALTREVVETGAPVLLRERSLLGVPLLSGRDVVGVLVLDSAEQPHPYSAAHVEIAAAIGRVAGAAIAQAQAAARLRAGAETAMRQNRLLRSAMTAENRFAQVVTGGRGLRALGRALAELSGRPVALYDAALQRVAAARGTDGAVEVRLLEDAAGAAEIVDALRATPAGGSATVGPLLAAGVRRRHLVAPVDVGDERWGWVVLMEHPSRLTSFDELVVRCAARYATLELAAEQRSATAAWDARSLLARQLIRGTQDEDVRRSAEHLGIDLDRPRVVAFVTAASHRAESIDPERLVDALSARSGAKVLATKGPEGVAIVLDVPDDAPLLVVRRAKAQLTEAIGEVAGTHDLIAGISAVCRDPRGVPRAYREAREVARCIDGFAGSGTHRVLAADDLGPGRLFVANGEPAGIDRFVEDAVGPLLTGGDGMEDLLRTLHVFFETGRSVRLSAAHLGIHENTVRLRCARVHAATGLDVAANARDQLTVQMSLLVLRLKGHPALASFDAAPEGRDAEGSA